jgi:hypothetical protein
MSGMARWSVAVLVTAAAFGIAAWVSGAFLLPAVMRSGADRWVLAAGLGVAVAALAALWGHSWAQAGRRNIAGRGEQSAGSAAAASSAAGGGRSITAGGDITGIASTGDGAPTRRRGTWAGPSPCTSRPSPIPSGSSGTSTR